MRRLGNGASLTTRFDYSYVSQYWRAADPRLRVAWYAGGTIPPGFSDESGDFGQFNARLTYAPADGKWEVSVFGTNLTDEYQLNSGFFHGIWGYDFATVGSAARVRQHAHVPLLIRKRGESKSLWSKGGVCIVHPADLLSRSGFKAASGSIESGR